MLGPMAEPTTSPLTFGHVLLPLDGSALAEAAGEEEHAW